MKLKNLTTVALALTFIPTQASDVSAVSLEKITSVTDHQSVLAAATQRTVLKEDIEKVLSSAKVNQAVQFMGAGSTGGGQGANGFLRDLQEPSFKCVANLEEFSKDYPTFQSLQGLIAKANIGFAHELKLEMKKARVCLVNSQLNSNIVPDQDGIVVSKTEYDQLAIRAIYPSVDFGYGIDIYINKAEFENMNDETQKSFLLMHELMHSFVRPEPAVSYINRLRSTIAELYQASLNEELTTEDLNEISENYNLNYINPGQYANHVAESIKFRSGTAKMEFFKALVGQMSTKGDERQAQFNEILGTLIYSQDYKNNEKEEEIVTAVAIMTAAGMDLNFTDPLLEEFNFGRNVTFNALGKALSKELNLLAGYIISQEPSIEVTKEQALSNFKGLVSPRSREEREAKLVSSVVSFLFKNMTTEAQTEQKRTLRKSARKSKRAQEIREILKSQDLI